MPPAYEGGLIASVSARESMLLRITDMHFSNLLVMAWWLGVCVSWHTLALPDILHNSKWWEFIDVAKQYKFRWWWARRHIVCTYMLLASWKVTPLLGMFHMKNYMCCDISSNMMELWPVKSPINENMIKALKSLVYNIVPLIIEGAYMPSTIYVSLYALNSKCLWTTAHALKN